jgi:outer membrane immunogenic protein
MAIGSLLIALWFVECRGKTMKKLVAFAYLAIVSLAITPLAMAPTCAIAADLPEAPYKAPVVATVYNWTGIYFGVNGGYGTGTQDPLSLFSNDFAPFSYTLSGGLFGGTAGAQIQSGHVVMGLEGDINWASMSGSGTGSVVKLGILQGTATISSKLSMIDTLRARVGYAWDNLLFYGTFGLALTNDSSSFTQTVGFVCNNGVVACTSKDQWHPGLAAGGGLEYGFTPNLSVKLEYLWVGAGVVSTLKENIVRAGVNWRFGG